MQRMSAVGAAVMRGVALGLGLPETFFRDRDGRGDPYWCMRIIHYPPLRSALADGAAEGAGGRDVDAAADTAAKALSGEPLGIASPLLGVPGVDALHLCDLLGLAPR